jgi:hypothetical protein
VDARLHQLQGKAKLVKSTEMLELLREFYRAKAAMRDRHVAAARFVSHYDFNNTYQYVIAREDVHLRWLIDAITDMGGQPEDPGPVSLEPSGKREQAQKSVITTDRDAAQTFVDQWTPRITALPNARHRTMLGVILGETKEHRRFFELALAGRADLLGRRADGAGTGGGVLATRWVGGEKT